MERKDVEMAILKKVLEIKEIYDKYEPNDHYLNMSFNHGFISINNSYFEELEGHNDIAIMMEDSSIDMDKCEYYVNGQYAHIRRGYEE